MPPVVAGGVVFSTSAAVLIIEILAVRLLAPYVGNSLETYSAIIGTVLAGIAAGTWAGGRLADRIPPRRLIGPLLVAGGGLSIAIPPIVRALGSATPSTSDQAIVLSACALFLPAAALSAVSPVVVKLELHDLSLTGRIVGRLSALGTAGGIAGTFLAGFVLIEAAPTSVTIVTIGALLLVGGVVAWVALVGIRAGQVATIAAVGLAAGGLSVVTHDPCERETTYHCARIEVDPDRDGGRTLVLDTLRHSYVDLDDPTHLEFAYTRSIDAVVAAAVPEGEAIDALHVGGGGFTLPRQIEATRPGSTSLVLEIDGGLVDLAEDELGLDPDEDLRVRVGDARQLVGGLDDAAYDVVVGDAFGDLAVPWHLTTEEFLAEVHRTLRPGGTYVANLIDYPPLRFVRAEAATLGAVFEHVAVVAPPEVAVGGGNVVVVASDDPIDVDGVRAALADRGQPDEVVSGPALVELIDGAPVLTDDYAPVDQWLARAQRPSRV